MHVLKVVACYLLLGLLSCSSTQVEVRKSVSENCRFIQRAGSLQCVVGKASLNAEAQAVKEFRKIARVKGVDSIVCCSRDNKAELLTAAGYDAKTGKLNCAGFDYIWADLYACETVSKEP